VKVLLLSMDRRSATHDRCTVEYVAGFSVELLPIYTAPEANGSVDLPDGDVISPDLPL